MPSARAPFLPRGPPLLLFSPNDSENPNPPFLPTPSGSPLRSRGPQLGRPLGFPLVAAEAARLARERQQREGRGRCQPMPTCQGPLSCCGRTERSRDATCSASCEGEAEASAWRKWIRTPLYPSLSTRAPLSRLGGEAVHCGPRTCRWLKLAKMRRFSWCDRLYLPPPPPRR